MQQTRIQPAVLRPAPRAIAQADEAAARRILATRDLYSRAHAILSRSARNAALKLLNPVQEYGVFDGDRLVETHTDPEAARLAAADNADATDQPGAYTVEPLCPVCVDLPAGDCDCP
ncbi:hypothetical protein ACQSSU_20360 [Micromonospora echinospora]